MLRKFIRKFFCMILTWIEGRFNWPIKDDNQICDAVTLISLDGKEAESEKESMIIEAVRVAVLNIYRIYMLVQYRSTHWRGIPFLMNVCYRSGMDIEIQWDDMPLGYREAHKIFSKRDLKQLHIFNEEKWELYQAEFSDVLREYLMSILKFKATKDPEGDCNFFVLSLKPLASYTDKFAKEMASKAYKRMMRIVQKYYEDSSRNPGSYVEFSYRPDIPTRIWCNRAEVYFWDYDKDNPRKLRDSKFFNQKLDDYLVVLLVNEGHFRKRRDIMGNTEYILRIETGV